MNKCKDHAHWNSNLNCHKCERVMNGKGCGFKHMLVDASIILELCEAKNSSEAENFIEERLTKDIMGHITTSQIGAVFKRIRELEMEYRKNQPMMERLDELKDRVERLISDGYLQIISIKTGDLELYKKLNPEHFNCQGHDQMEVCVALRKGLDVVTLDNPLIEAERQFNESSIYPNIKIIHLRDV